MSSTRSTCRLTFNVDANTVRTSLSAVRHIGQHLWLGCDETATLERLVLKGECAEDHLHVEISDFLELPNFNNEEVDIEGIAYADYYLWFVGSHSLKRKAVRPENIAEDNVKRLRKVECEENRYTLGRIPLVNGQLFSTYQHPEKPDVTLTAAQLKRKKKKSELVYRLEEDPHLEEFLKGEIPGKDNGFDVEGLAVLGDRLLLGLRGPVLRGWAVLLELHLEEEEPGILRLQKVANGKDHYRKHFLDLGGLGIRDLCLWQNKLLILAGPTMVLDGSVRVFSQPLVEFQSNESLLKPSLVLEIPYGEGCDRAEGLTVFGEEQKELLLVYDAPAPERLQGENSVLADRISL